jgi:hypothetical protein
MPPLRNTATTLTIPAMRGYNAMKILSRSIPILCAALLAGCMAPPRDLDLSLARPTMQAQYRAELKPLAEPITLNKLHAWDLKLTQPDGEPLLGAQVRIDGGMPQHHHGLPTQPRVTRELGGGHYLIEGMKFSMSGWWEIKLAINAARGADNVTFNVVLPES